MCAKHSGKAIVTQTYGETSAEENQQVIKEGEAAYKRLLDLGFSESEITAYLERAKQQHDQHLEKVRRARNKLI